MLNSQSANLNVDVESGHHGENNNVAPSNVVRPLDPNGVPIADPVNANSQVAININCQLTLKIAFAEQFDHLYKKHPKEKVMELACG